VIASSHTQKPRVLGSAATAVVTLLSRLLLLGVGISLPTLLSGCAAFSQSNAVANRSIETTIRVMALACTTEELRIKYHFPQHCPGIPDVAAKLHEMSLQGNLTEQLSAHSFACQTSKTTTTCDYHNTLIIQPGMFGVRTNPDIEDRIDVRAVYPTSIGPIELDQIHVEVKHFQKQERTDIDPGGR
jgi:hypothetical protein